MRSASLLILATTCLLVAVAAGPSAAPPPANQPATATFDDSQGMRIRSDGLGSYREGLDCVRSWFSPSQGNYYFRTASNTLCDYDGGLPTFENQRLVRLDLSNVVAGHEPASCTLDDGYHHQLNARDDNLIVDARLIADDLFKATAVDTPVTLHLDLYPNFFNDRPSSSVSFRACRSPARRASERYRPAGRASPS
jgi:hypothetical protein